MSRKFIIAAVSGFLSLTASAYTFEELRSLGGSRPVALSGTVEGIVVSDWRSDNTDLNPNRGHNIVDTGESLRTAYLQSLDGCYGIRLKFERIYGNRLAKGDRVVISLDGCTLVMEKEPERYTVTGLRPEKVSLQERGTPLPAKVKHISELTPEDIHTYVTLTGVEFPKKIGGYINVIEHSVQKSDINRDVWYPELNGWLPSNSTADCWARLVMDDRGDAVYMLVNSTCGWRRNDVGVPQGIGNISGIIVHNTLPRYGASVGEYSIRPVDRSDIAMPQQRQSSYETVVSWEYDYNRYAELVFEKKGVTRWLKPHTVKDDRIKAENGEGWLWTDSGAYMALDEEYDARHSFDGWKPSRMLGARSNAAIRFDAKAPAWFRFDASGKVTGYNGIYLETSTKDVKDGRLYFDFSFVASREHTKYACDFPVEWKVAYSEDGMNFTELPQVYLLRPIIATNLLHGKIIGVKTHSEMAMGFSEYSVELPPELRGKDKVVLRIAPCSDVTAVMPERWDAPSAAGKASKGMQSDVIIRFGTLAVKYLK